MQQNSSSFLSILGILFLLLSFEQKLIPGPAPEPGEVMQPAPGMHGEHGPTRHMAKPGIELKQDRGGVPRQRTIMKWDP